MQEVNIRLKILGLLILGLLLSLFIGHKLYTQRDLSLVLKKISLPQPFTVARSGDNSFIFSNGRYFVEYDTSNNQTKSLSTDANLPLPQISNLSVSPNGDYLIFQSLEQDENDFLGATLKEKGVDNFDTPSFWWLYDLKTKVFRPIDARDKKTQAELGGDEANPLHDTPPENISARMSDDGQTIFVLTRDSDGSHSVNKLTTEDLVKIGSFSLDSASSILEVQAGKVVTLQNSQIVIHDTEGNELRRIDGSYSIIYSPEFNPTNRLVAYRQSERRQEAIPHYIDLESGSVKSIGSTDDESNIAQSHNGSLLAHKKDGALIITEDRFFDIHYSVKISDDQESSISKLNIMYVISEKLLLLVDQESGEYYLAGNNDTEFQAIEKTQFAINNPGCPDCELTYFPENQLFIANVFGTVTPEKKNVIYSSLQAQGINPDRVAITFSGFTPPTQ